MMPWLAWLVLAAPPEHFACARYQGVVRHHSGSLDLLADGTFHLRHANATEEGSESTVMNGTWKREGDVLVLAPTDGDRFFSQGDGHRWSHGEDVHLCTWREPLAGGERRLTIGRADGVERVWVPEIRTSLSKGALECDLVQPKATPSPGYRCEDAKR